MRKIATIFTLKKWLDELNFGSSSHFFNVTIEKFVAIFRISGVWHVGWWNSIFFWYFLGVCLIKVSFKVNKGNKFGDFGYYPLNRGCPLNTVSSFLNTGFTVLRSQVICRMVEPSLRNLSQKQHWKIGTLITLNNFSSTISTILYCLE